jgi:PAS domain S-box-containing protein
MKDGRKILAVDDEWESLKLLTDILTPEGYQVRPADRGELALASIAIERPDLILLDVRMPGMNGLEICKKLKQSASSRDIPVIFISGAKTAEDHVEGLRLGAVDFISKPFRPEELLARVHTHLELSRLRSSLAQQLDERTAELRQINEQLKKELAERSLAEVALQASQERFRIMADTAPILIWMSGPDKLCTFFNRGWLEFTGRTMEQELGYGWTAGVHPDDLELCSRTYTSSFDERRSFQMEYRLRRADGAYRRVLDNGVPRFDPGGPFAGYIGCCVDITHFQRNQEQMLAFQKLESLGVLAAGFAHDFNNLFGSVLGEAHLALAEIPSDAPARENIERIDSLILRASEIVKLLLAYAGAARETVEEEPLDLSAVVEEVLTLVNPSMANGVVLRSNLAKDLPDVCLNAAQLRLVVMNLVKNACEALPGRAGIITVTTRRGRTSSGSTVNGTEIPEEPYVSLEVSDTGCGMDAEVCSKVFDPFYSTKYLGRGLGLAAVEGIVRSHGGSIGVTSAPGQGTTFTIVLPSTGNPKHDTHIARSRASVGQP